MNTTTPTAPRTEKAKPFVPAGFDPSNFDNIQPLGKALQDRPLTDAAAIDHWVRDLTALWEHIDEFGSRRYIDKACHTDDEKVQNAFLHFVREVQPRLRPMLFELQKKYLQSPHRTRLTDASYPMMNLDWQTEVEIFRDENVPLLTRETELANDYDKIMSAMMIEFRGKSYTQQQMAPFLEETDRKTREEAWRLTAARRLKDRPALDAIFEKLLDLRGTIARNAGMGDYRDYTWKSRKRFDYTPHDCLSFGDSVEKLCVPIVEEIDGQRKKALKVDALRPWDAAVDIRGRSPLKPFDAKDIPGFVATTRKVFDQVSPALGKQFDTLRENGNLDLDSRKGKQPGGFQSALEKCKQPFIFMNAAGVQRDVETLLHEGGHAFHYIAARDQWNVFSRHAPLEFCEVASMSMELLADDHLSLYYGNDAEAARAKRVHLEGVIRVLTWIATIDGFQHWLYTNPGHSLKQRTDAWLALHKRFGGGTDWSGLDAERAALWHRQLHLYHVPFYYIEYGIAQLGALQVWLNYRKNPTQALQQLLKAFALGGTRPLPELFTTAGIRFSFDAATIQPLMAAVREELAKLPE